MTKIVFLAQAWDVSDLALVLDESGVRVMPENKAVTMVMDSDYWESGKKKLQFRTREALKTFCDLYGIDTPSFPSDKYRNAFQQTVSLGSYKGTVPWNKMIPIKTFYNEASAFIRDFADRVSALDTNYWEVIVPRVNSMLNRMRPSAIDLGKINFHATNATDGQKAILDSFVEGGHVGRPNGKDIVYAPVVKYTTFGTKTGRLKVVSGPNILHLKKEYRDILTSSFGANGSLWYLDYSSLEPRILLCSSKTPLIGSLPQDIYTKALSDLGLAGQVPRNIAKTVILSALYGQSEENTIKQLKDYLPKPDDFVWALNSYFGIDELKQKLSQDLLKTNGKYITNLYGRPVMCDDAKPYALLNYYVQSTAVDVALLGFEAIVNRLREHNLTDMIRPVFVLHDALILDIHNEIQDVVPKLERLGSTGIQKFKQVDFYLRAEKLQP